MKFKISKFITHHSNQLNLPHKYSQNDLSIKLIFKWDHGVDCATISILLKIIFFRQMCVFVCWISYIWRGTESTDDSYKNNQTNLPIRLNVPIAAPPFCNFTFKSSMKAYTYINLKFVFYLSTSPSLSLWFDVFSVSCTLHTSSISCSRSIHFAQYPFLLQQHLQKPL